MKRIMIIVLLMVLLISATTSAAIGPITAWPSVYEQLEASAYPVLSARVVTQLETQRALNRAAVDTCQAPTPDPIITPLIWRPNVFYIVDYWDDVTHWNDGKFIWVWNQVWYWVNPDC
jgi:hypothetical protein